LLTAEHDTALLEIASVMSLVEGGAMRYPATAAGRHDEDLRAAFFGPANYEEAR
jgi:hypothetical protein